MLWQIHKITHIEKYLWAELCLFTIARQYYSQSEITVGTNLFYKPFLFFNESSRPLWCFKGQALFIIYIYIYNELLYHKTFDLFGWNNL